MMKRDLKQFKIVAGDKVENNPYENKYNKSQNYRERDIDSNRLKKWDLSSNLSENKHIQSSKHNQQSLTYITKFKPSRKQFGGKINLHYLETQENTFKPQLKQIDESKYRREVTPIQRRMRPQTVETQNLDSLRILDHIKYPKNTFNNSTYRHNQSSKQMENYQASNNQSDFKFNQSGRSQNNLIQYSSVQNKLDLKQNDQKDLRRYSQYEQQKSLTPRNKSQFTLAWDN